MTSGARRPAASSSAFIPTVLIEHFRVESRRAWYVAVEEMQEVLDDHLRRAMTLSGLAAAHLNLGQLNRALQELSEALEVHRQLRDVRGEAVILNELGNVYYELGGAVRSTAPPTPGRLPAKPRGLTWPAPLCAPLLTVSPPEPR